MCVPSHPSPQRTAELDDDERQKHAATVRERERERERERKKDAATRQKRAIGEESINARSVASCDRTFPPPNISPWLGYRDYSYEQRYSSASDRKQTKQYAIQHQKRQSICYIISILGFEFRIRVRG